MMDGSDILLVTATSVTTVLKNREAAVLDAVRTAYTAHARGECVLPHSLFLRLPGEDGNRIIALPSHLGGDHPITGMKWIASFPRNIDRGIERASAVVILNDAETGRPLAILEGSTISAARTAASAALAFQLMAETGTSACCGIVGCGRINFEIVRFLLAVNPDLRSLVLCDLHSTRAEAFAAACRRTWPMLTVSTVGGIADLAARARLLSFATTASTPYVTDASVFQPGSLILHISLRDLAPQVILACDNVVDDVDHVCRENTAIQLAEKCTGGRKFIRCVLGDILTRRAGARGGAGCVTVFSPFGLGILDLAVAGLVYDVAQATGECQTVGSFLPPSWIT